MISAVIQFDNGDVAINDSPVHTIGTTFKSGIYTVTATDKGPIIKSTKLKENHIPYPSRVNSICSRVLKCFFSDGVREKVNKLGYLHKLGILLYGKQGTGKTSMMNFYGRVLTEKRDAICFICDDSSTLSGAVSVAMAIREIQQNLIVFLCDEFDKYAKKSESDIKNFLDGNKSIENSIVIACTNYIDDIPKTIKERQSRFRIVEEVLGIDDQKTIRKLLKDKSDLIDGGLFSEEELELSSKHLSKGSTIDEIKNFILDKLTNNIYKIPSRSKIGFNKEEEEDEIHDPSSLYDKFLTSSYMFVRGRADVIEDNPEELLFEKADKSV